MIGRFCLMLLVIVFGSCAAGSGMAAEPVRILFIGNSYTYYNDMPRMLAAMAATGGNEAEVRSVTKGGASLRQLWDEGEALDALARERWDYVVLQDHSLMPLSDRRTMDRSMRLFDERIRAAGARTVLYVTWARAFARDSQGTIDAAYQGIGDRLHACIVPVGQAWSIALARQPKPALYDSDQSHPSMAGSYLAAYVFHRMLFGRLPALPEPPPGLDAARHAALLDAAAKATAGRPACALP